MFILARYYSFWLQANKCVSAKNKKILFGPLDTHHFSSSMLYLDRVFEGIGGYQPKQMRMAKKQWLCVMERMFVCAEKVQHLLHRAPDEGRDYKWMQLLLT